MSPSGGGGRRVVVVTGGGGGIGAAVAEELGRAGAHVVTVDPMVTLDGASRAEVQGETTADRIVAAGGSARATDLSVTDRAGVQALFEELRREHGRLDGVVNVAGITRPTSFAAGTDDDWRAVLGVHLDGYRNVLESALPIMAEQGHGRVLGVTSGSGWRPADTGAYGCAKRAVASLTWELGRRTPPGVAVNAMSPIAVTRMVTAALGKQAVRPGGTGAATGGLSLGSLPAPEELGPLGAHLVGEAFGWCRGLVLFAGGSEVAVVERPHLLEVVTTTGAGSLAHLVEAFAERALLPAERNQTAGGGTNPRFGDVLAAGTGARRPTGGRCLVVTDDPGGVGELVEALAARGATTEVLDAGRVDGGFAGAAAALASVEPFDAVVIRRSGPAPSSGGEGWQRVLAGHDGLVDAIHADAGWVRAATDRSSDAGRPVRVVTLVEATTAGGRSRAQAATQLARASRKATDGRVAAFAVSVESTGAAATTASAALAAHLACSPAAADLAGAELAVGDGWLGLRSHPRPSTSIVTGSGPVPGWFDEVLRDAVDRTAPEGP
jgi:NAD(P)-dependent dehydrogenase (short-subunit alcohol dehydrogenase family)